MIKHRIFSIIAALVLLISAVGVPTAFAEGPQGSPTNGEVTTDKSSVPERGEISSRPRTTAG